MHNNLCIIFNPVSPIINSKVLYLKPTEDTNEFSKTIKYQQSLYCIFEGEKMQKTLFNVTYFLK